MTDMADVAATAWIMPPTPAATAVDIAAVQATVRDFFEGWYDADAERMQRAVHPSLAKRSFGQDLGQTPVVRGASAEQMVAWTSAGDGRTVDPEQRGLQIDVVDVSGGIAAVVVHSFDDVEYLHLVATPDGWQIVNALWRFADGRGPTL
jgi:Putative lumazine-binding